MYSDPSKTFGNDPLDKSIPARDFAQYLANQIAGEARYNSHKFEGGFRAEYSKLVKHHEVVQIEHETFKGVVKGMPVGLERTDVYFVE